MTETAVKPELLQHMPEGSIPPEAVLVPVNAYKLPTARESTTKQQVENVTDSQILLSRSADGRPLVHVPLYERCSIIPYREAARAKSQRDVEIEYQVALAMEKEGVLRRVGDHEATLVQATVLVDKWKVRGRDEIRILPPEPGRYRLCLDARPLNALRWVDNKSALVVNELCLNNQVDGQSQKTKFSQSQAGALTRVESISVEKRKFFVKIDLSAAFHTLEIAPGLQRLLCFKVKGVTYAYVRLPMGWYLAPQIFQSTMDGVLSPLKEKVLGCAVPCWCSRTTSSSLERRKKKWNKQQS
jgi:hypothetical protein